MREIQIDLARIQSNYKQLKALVAPSEVMAIVKANAYGHGMHEVAQALEEISADALGVADLEEAIALRAAGIKSRLMCWILSVEDDFAMAAEQDIELGVSNFEVLEARAISASISSELWTSSTIAITLALLAIFAYILIRFGHWQYSLGAIVGLAHDAFFVISIFSLLHGYLPFTLDVNQAFIAAILTVIGYSMNDTVIVFDRIRENLRKSKPEDNHGDIINSSLNRTLSRTFNTSMILFVVVLIMFIFGGPAIKGFLFALLVGVLIGTYSSLCVATPILLDFSKRLRA